MNEGRVKMDEIRCCCCYSTEDLSSMLRPLYVEGAPQILVNLIADCFQIELRSQVNEQSREFYVMCRKCITRLKDAVEFRKVVQNAYDRIDGHFMVIPVSVDNFMFTPNNDSEIKPYFIRKRSASESDDESNLDDSNANDQTNSITDDEEIFEDANSGFMDKCKNRNASSIKKLKRNSGQEYRTKGGKVVPAKKFENVDCMCSKRCITLISESERKNLFHQFWNMADFNKQNVYLYSNTRRFTVKRRRPRDHTGTPRTYGYKYYLSDDVLVCKKFFIDTFSISSGRLTRVLTSPDVGKDMRGRMQGSRRKTAELILDAVRAHIRSFPTFECDPKQPDRKYLSPGLNVKKMFALYVQKCEENHLTQVNEWTYRKIFKNEFNLHFQEPRRDALKTGSSHNFDEDNPERLIKTAPNDPMMRDGQNYDSMKFYTSNQENIYLNINSKIV